MTLFIYEHLTSGALCSEAYSLSLMHEGNAMLQAITGDVLALGHNIAMMRDARLDNASLIQQGIELFEVDNRAAYQTYWQQSINRYQQFLVIAPESDAILATLVAELEQHNKTVLGCDATSIRLCSDKLENFQLLAMHGLMSPQTLLAENWLTLPHPSEACWIIKPRDGAGCESTYQLTTQQAQALLPKLITDTAQELIVQPFIEGQNLSLSLFIDENAIELLSVNYQHIEITQQQLRLQHTEPQRDDLLDKTTALRLAETIHATIPGLWGFIGVDLIQTQDTLWLIEINPRLTSSYAEAAMRQHKNPASRLHRTLKPTLPADYD